MDRNVIHGPWQGIQHILFMEHRISYGSHLDRNVPICVGTYLGTWILRGPGQRNIYHVISLVNWDSLLVPIAIIFGKLF